MEPLQFFTDPRTGDITSLLLYGQEILHAPSVPFMLGIRKKDGSLLVLSSEDAGMRRVAEDGGFYTGFPVDIDVSLSFSRNDPSAWKLRVSNRSEARIEWAEAPCLTLKPLKQNGGTARIVYPYNEGALVDDVRRHPEIGPGYPSVALADVFPNMISSQFLLYLTKGNGLYFAAEDEARGVKQVSFTEDRGGVRLKLRCYSDTAFGESFEPAFPCVLRAFQGNWQEGAALYRDWFQKHLPAGLKPAAKSGLPAWYYDTPLVVSYPVRGVHDQDVMTPNALFPYTNALPMLDDIAGKTGCRLLVLLMHWEGTAPWAPPYVWPPFGGEALFNEFAERLHERGHLIGVYCSGFGYTLKSKLVGDYDREEEFRQKHLEALMCTGPKGELESTVCTAQRSGYDICVGAPGAGELLNAAYGPLFESAVDYAQILDQNHGGGQYFCYSASHGHPPGPGAWMTDAMRRLLEDWNEKGKGKLFGCESAAAEPFLPYLRFSDNRYELNWQTGEPVPLYAFLYHEYLRNFMGNQVSLGLSSDEDTLCYRIAYSFAAGDCPTLVFTPDGRLFSSWGDHDFTKPAPDLEKTLGFVSALRQLLKNGAAEYLTDGRMIPPVSVKTEEVVYHRASDGSEVRVPAVVTSAWEKQHKRAQILINHTDSAQNVRIGIRPLTLPPRSAILVPLMPTVLV